jgi:hypothetical protein
MIELKKNTPSNNRYLNSLINDKSYPISEKNNLFLLESILYCRTEFFEGILKHPNFNLQENINSIFLESIRRGFFFELIKYRKNIKNDIKCLYNYMQILHCAIEEDDFEVFCFIYNNIKDISKLFEIRVLDLVDYATRQKSIKIATFARSHEAYKPQLEKAIKQNKENTYLDIIEIENNYKKLMLESKISNF